MLLLSTTMLPSSRFSWIRYLLVLFATAVVVRRPPVSLDDVSIEIQQEQQQYLVQGEVLPPPQPLPNPLQLLRIPKAGSSSFSAFLRLQYNCTSEQHPPGDCTRQNARACPAVQGCTNHRPPPRDASLTYATVLRNPDTRYISAYYYQGHHGEMNQDNITLHTLWYPEFDNTQTNYLSGRPIGTWQMRRPPVRTAPPQSPLPPDPTRLHDALWMLQHATFVGLVEYWNDSLLLFCRLYHCTQPLPTVRERQNDSDQRSYPYNDTAALEAIHNAHHDDWVLYRQGQAKFCAMLRVYEHEASFVAQLSKEVWSMCAAVVDE